MNLLEFAFLFHQNRRRGVRRTSNDWLLSGGVSRAAVKGSCDQLNQTGVFYISCGRYYKIAVGKLARMKTHRGLMVEGRDSLFGAFYWTPERVIWEIRGVEQLSEQFIGRIFNHFHFFKDDFLLALQVLLVKARMGNNVSKKIDG